MKNTIARLKWGVQSLAVQIILFLVVLLIPLNALYFYTTNQYMNTLSSQAAYGIETLASYHLNLLQYNMQNLTLYIQQQLLDDTRLNTVFAQKGDPSYTIARNALLLHFKLAANVKNSASLFFLYSPKLNDLQLIRQSRLSVDVQKLSEIIRENAADYFSSTWKPIYIDDESYIAHAFKLHNMYLGTIISLDALRHEVQQALPYESARVVLDASNTITYDSTDIAVTSKIPLTDLYMHILVKQQEIHEQIPSTQKTLLVLAYASIAIIPCLAFLLYHLVYRPTRIINQALSAFCNGDRDTRIAHFSHSSELKNIELSFNVMAERIDRLILENYEQNMAYQQIQLENYQLMIRPHFLLNTFSLLYTMTQIDQSEKAGEFILYLADYFRSTYKGIDSLSPIAQEFDLVQSYIEIAQHHHPEQIEFEADIHPDTLSCSVPALLLHNYIENAINHAMTHTGVLHIRLSSLIDEGYLILVVADDGVGIAPEIVTRLNAGDRFQTNGRVHIGLHNTYHRLQIIYHGKASIRIHSILNKGTCIETRIPLDFEREQSL